MKDQDAENQKAPDKEEKFPLGRFTLDARGRILDGDRKTCALLDRGLEAIAGRQMQSLVAGPFQGVFHQLLGKIAAGESFENVEIQLKRGESDTFFALLSGEREDAPEGKWTCRAMMLDVTEKLRETRRLRERERVYLEIAETAPVGILHFDGAGDLQFVNRYFLNMAGMREEDLRKAGWGSALFQEDRTRMMRDWEKVRAQGAFGLDLECRLMRRDGAVTWCFAQIEAIRDDRGKPFGSLVLFTDITRRKISEEAALSGAQALESMNERLTREIARRMEYEKGLRQALEEKTLLLREVHHRVKNNLQIVSGLLDMRALRSRDPQVAEALQDARGKIHAISIIHSLLYRSENLNSARMGDIILRMIDALQRVLGDGTSERQSAFDVEGDVVLSIDQAIPCAFVVNELVSNAIKHARPADGAHGTTRVRIRLEEDAEGQVLVEVTDNGSGLPDGFDPFKTDGLGLKLSETLAASQLKGSLTHELGRGTSFALRFPKKDPAPAAEDQRPEEGGDEIGARRT